MEEMQKKWLAYTTPDQRAKMDNGMQMFAARMKERGLTPPPMRGAGFSESSLSPWERVGVRVK